MLADAPEKHYLTDFYRNTLVRRDWRASTQTRCATCCPCRIG